MLMNCDSRDFDSTSKTIEFYDFVKDLFASEKANADDSKDNSGLLNKLSTAKFTGVCKNKYTRTPCRRCPIL